MSVKKNLVSRLTRTRLLFPLLLIVLLLPALYWYTTRPKETAAWWNESWVYRKKIPLTNSSGSTQSDFQIQITIDTTQYVTNNKLQNDCDDIRFTDTNGGELSYWIEPNTCNTTTTIAWVKVPSIPTTGADIYWYYGNPSANSKSSPTNTFVKEIDGVVGAWDLDETAGATEITDKSGNNNTGVLGCLGDSCANPTFSTGLFGNAGDFSDASEDYIRIPNSTSLRQQDQGTIAFWFKPTVTPYLDGLVTQANSARWDSSNVLFIFNQSNNLRFLLGKYSNGSGADTITNSIITSSNSITAGQWHFAVGSWRKIDTDTTELSLSLNGATPTTIQHDLIVGTDKDVVIGSWGWGQDPNHIRSYAGLIDQVRYYDKVLSNQEITDLYSATLNRQGYVTTNYPSKELVRQYNTNVSIGSLATEEIGPGPIAYWKFDEGYGQTANDSTSNNNDGTLGATTGSASDDPTWLTEDQCVSGKCLQFDGGDYAQVLDNPKIEPSNAITVSAWIKPTSPLTSYQMIVDKQASGGSYGYTLRLNNATGKALFRIYTNSGHDALGTTVLTANKWYFIVGTYDGTNVNIYVDGKLETSTPTTGTITYDSSNLHIGRRSDGYYFQGTIDEPKIYPYARTEAQIKEDFNMGAAKLGQADQTFLSDGLVGYWKMDETSGISVADASGNGNNGTLTNAQESGTSDASGNTTTTLVDTDSASLSTTDDAYNGMVLRFTAACGSITSGTERIISDYTGATKTITVSTALAQAPDSCAYEVRHQVGGKFGNGVGFDKTNDYITVPDANYSFNTFTSFSYGAWVYPTTTNVDATIMGDWADSATGTMIYIASGNTPDCRLNGNAQIVTSSTSLTTNQWSHVFCTWDGTNLKIYVNGVQTGSTSASTIDDGGDFKFGEHGGGGGRYKGRIDDARLYNRTLSATEIKQLYEWAPGPIRYWNFDEKVKGDSQTVYDQSGNGDNGTTSDGNNNTGMDCTKTGKYGTACEFDDIDDSITITNVTEMTGPTASFTQTYWVKVKGYGTYHAILGSTWSRWNATYFSSGTNFGFTAYNNGDHFYNWTIQDFTNQWQHLSLVFDSQSGYVTLYQNGQSKGSLPIENFLTTGVQFIGAQSGSNGIFNGLIDEVKIYNYARTPEQIRQDMAGTANPGVSSGSILPQPIAHWPFDEQTGQTAYDKYGSNNGTLGANSSLGSDDPTWKTKSNCKVNGCLSFDGGDYVFSTDSTALSITDDLTISLWIKPNINLTSGIANNHRFVNKVDDYGLTYMTSGNIEFFYKNASGNIQVGLAPTTFTASTWYHLAVVWNSDTVTFYKNGVALETDDLANEPIRNGSGSVYLGSWSGSSQYFNGSMDEVKIYNSALTEEQIKQDMNAGSTLAVGTTTSEAADLSDGAGNPPIIEWKLDEKTGTTANDTSGNNNTGSATNTTWKSTKDCKQGACLSFTSSSSSYVTTSTDPGTMTSGTYSLWVKPSTLNAGMGWIDSAGTAGNGFDIFQWTGNILYFRAGNQSSVSISDWNPNTWYHLALVWNGTNYYGYVNGKQVTSGTQSGSRTGQISIGRVDGGYYFTGLIDHVKIYNYARTPAQIAYDYNRGAPIAHWKMDECQGSTIHDSSDNGNHGTWNSSGGTQTSVGTCTTAGTAWGNGATGKFEASLNFDGTDDYVNIGDDDKYTFFDNFSVAFWMNPKTGGNNFFWGGISKAGIAGNREWEIGFDPTQSDAVRFLIGDNNGAWVTDLIRGAGLIRNQWHHVVGVVSGNQARIYLDGNQSGASATYPSTMKNTSSPVYIGGVNTYETQSSFNGQLDDVRIYNYALSETQVKKIMNEGSALRFGD